MLFEPVIASLVLLLAPHVPIQQSWSSSTARSRRYPTSTYPFECRFNEDAKGRCDPSSPQKWEGHPQNAKIEVYNMERWYPDLDDRHRQSAAHFLEIYHPYLNSSDNQD